MTRGPRLLALATAVATLLSVHGVRGAGADHLPDQGEIWALTTWGADYTLETYFTTTFPSGAKRERVRSGANAWNIYASDGPSDPEPRFVFQATDRVPNSYTTTCGGEGSVTVFWDDLDFIAGSTLGVEYSCVYARTPSRMAASSVAFDSSRSNWYDGVGDARDPLLGLIGGSADFWSIAGHELGHSMAFNHYDDGDDVCKDTGAQATMCPKYKTGTERLRSLEWHDYITFQNLYPAYFV